MIKLLYFNAFDWLYNLYYDSTKLTLTKYSIVYQFACDKFGGIWFNVSEMNFSLFFLSFHFGVGPDHK